MPESSPSTLNFRRRQRLTQARQFQAVFGAKVRKARGPITVFAAPNGLAHARLGLSIGRRVGPAVTRNALKRRLREAFRVVQHTLAPGYDYVVTAQPHEIGATQNYIEILADCCAGLDREWARRRRRDAEPLA